MKIVIDIDEDLLARVIKECEKDWPRYASPYLFRLFKAVADGKPIEEVQNEKLDH